MIYLASGSPRRRDLLTQAGIEFTVIPSGEEGSVPQGTKPKDAARMLAERKCRNGMAFAEKDGIVLAADTLVALDDLILGKPKDEADAYAMLMALSGKTHHVYTGVAVAKDGILKSAVADTAVTFRAFDEKEAKRYIKTGEPMDKAGAYGIQGKGGKLVAGYKGAFDNVIGLPMAEVTHLLDVLQKSLLMKEAARLLQERYPEAVCALEHEGDAWKLLVMGRLSAQCTDARVNATCKELFAKYPTPQAMADADIDELCEAVKPCGLYRRKGADLKDASRLLIEKYNGILPNTMEELLTFPGVGRKIANLLLGDVYRLPAIVTDTHCIRICGRLGAYDEQEKNPVKIEKMLWELLDAADGSDFCHRIVHFGRDICTARSPKCQECPMQDICRHNLQKRK